MSMTPTSSSSTPQHRSTPQPQASPSGSPYGTPPSSSATKPLKASASKPKATNVFTNDGSFLERFQRSKKEEEEKKKAEDDIARKRNFDERFKNRGKRPAPDSSAPSAADDPPTKKAKGDKDSKPLTQYEKEVKSYAGRSLKDDGIGVRPLVK